MKYHDNVIIYRSTITRKSTSVEYIGDTNQCKSNDIVNHVGVQVSLDVSDVKEFSF